MLSFGDFPDLRLARGPGSRAVYDPWILFLLAIGPELFAFNPRVVCIEFAYSVHKSLIWKSVRILDICVFPEIDLHFFGYGEVNIP
jgi:hypothetical protein